MKRFEGILMCTDLDGTLLKDDKTVSKENREAIEYFKAEGGYFTFVTGRVPCISGSIVEKVRPNAPFGCTNGGGVFDHEKGEYVYMKTVPESVREIVAEVEKQLPEVGFQYDMADTIYFCRENDTMANFRANTGIENICRDYRTISGPIAKIIFGTKDDAVMEKLIELINNHPRANEVNGIRSEHDLYDLVPKGADKGVAVEELAKHLGIDINKTIAVGDYLNDIPMIEKAGVGIAMANALPEVKAAADYVTVSNEENAIARIISDIEEGRIKL